MTKRKVWQTHQKPEAELLAATWVKLKAWYGSVPKDEQTALTDEWALFVKQKSLLGTTRENFIDPRFTEAYSDLRSLMQLAVDLEAQHDQHHVLDKKPPIFPTVAFSGIVDEPADYEEIGYVAHARSN